MGGGAWCPGWAQGTQAILAAASTGNIHAQLAVISSDGPWAEEKTGQLNLNLKHLQGATDQAAREGLLPRGFEAGAWHPSHRLRARKFRRSVSSLGSSPRFCPPSSAWASHLNSVPEFSCLLDCVSLTEGL